MAARTSLEMDDALLPKLPPEPQEVIEGVPVPVAPTGFVHGRIEWQIGWVLGSFVQSHQFGEVVVGDVLFRLDPNGRNDLAADVAFIRRERLPPPEAQTGAFHGPPDLAVEIISPSNSAEEIQRKVQIWLAAGTSIVLLVYPETRNVVLWRANGAMMPGDDAVLDLDPTVPGFQCQVSDLFPPDLLPDPERPKS